MTLKPPIRTDRGAAAKARNRIDVGVARRHRRSGQPSLTALIGFNSVSSVAPRLPVVAEARSAITIGTAARFPMAPMTDTAPALPDLEQCEAEPIHIPGSIQPHGVLLALAEADLRILQASMSAQQLLGVSAERLLGRDLAEALDPALAEAVRDALPRYRARPDVVASFEWRAPGTAKVFAAYVHLSDRTVVLELEASAATSGDLSEMIAEAMRAFGVIRKEMDLSTKLQAATDLFRRLTGYDRVMVYRFDEDWHGEVIAEARRPDLEPYLGLHYPASDIPSQARHIFSINPYRVILDVDYVPSVVQPAANAISDQPLDLSRSVLRSVSPVHLEYLRNMGVGSTLTMSLIRDGRLWGLVACHHKKPRALCAKLREIATWMAQDLATQIALTEEVADRQYAAHLKDCRDRVIFLMRQGARLPALLGGAELANVLGAIGADGVAFIRGEDVVTGGATPDPRHMLDIAARLSTLHPNSPSQLFATDCLSEHLPGTADLADSAAGIALFPLDAAQSIKLMWFRGEQLREVTWGGNPDKAVDVSPDGRLSPRQSFAAWREIVRLHSRRWRPEELESARKLGTLIDIEWRKMTEEALKRSEERLREAAEEALRLSQESFRLAVDNMPDGLVIYDERMRYRFVNAVSLKRGGLPVDAYLGRRDDEIYPADVYVAYLPHLRETYATQTATTFECTLSLATGRYDLVVTYVPMLEHAEVYQVFGFYHDITERKRSEAKLAEQAAQLREADWRKDEFLAMLAHELRNPLAPISNAVQLLRRGGSEAELAWCLAVIDRQTLHLARLVDDLLDISRISRGTIELRLEPLDLADIVARALETSGPVIAARRHSLHVERPQEPLIVQGDLVRLTQVVSNLLTNAAKFTEDGGQIWLTVEAAAEHIAIRVRDSGCGIDQAQLSLLFDLFFQVDRSIARTEGGLGIGLSLAKRLVEMHGGTIEAHSEGRGRGSEFCVRLPRLPDLSSAPLHAATAHGNALSATPTAGGLRILVVDDNRDAIDSLELLLGGEGHEVLVAYDGESALRLAMTMQPDVVLLDIGLPGMDGYAIASALRQRFGHDALRIIAITGYGQSESRERSKSAGFDLHLVKPIDFEGLLAVLSEYRRFRESP
jgi:light-regulated signal transduction histidine kinase (bacteriophytochrome)/ActR/RegA family two-component response regulator